MALMARAAAGAVLGGDRSPGLPLLPHSSRLLHAGSGGWRDCVYQGPVSQACRINSRELRVQCVPTASSPHCGARRRSLQNPKRGDRSCCRVHRPSSPRPLLGAARGELPALLSLPCFPQLWCMRPTREDPQIVLNNPGRPLSWGRAQARGSQRGCLSHTAQEPGPIV